MDWNDSPEQAAFREEAAKFIQERLPEYYRNADDDGGGEGLFGWYADRISDDPKVKQAADDWAKALAERGWVAPHWPKEYGGGGLTTMEQFVLGAEMARAKAPMVGGSGVLLLGPTLIIHGSEELKSRVLPKILKGETAYAQGYSEPGAGSDLGSLQTRAVRDGDEYVVNGQKIWTSAAHLSDALFLLARTDPDAPKHRGISFLVLEDIHTPGLSVRPLIGADWGHTVNETFFEDVRVPAANLVGEENRGWYVGMTLLDFERSGIGGAIGQQAEIRELIDAAKTDERSTLDHNSSLRQRIADRWTEVEVSYNFSLRIASMQASGLVPNYEASMGKMFGSEVGQEIYRTGVRTFGLYSNLWTGDSLAPLGGAHTHGYVRSIPSTIAGGSSEIQRNIIATRGLGLPRG
jgi:alkylation response protein AidB-like acyl-CoA dehydrogenase